ncbi:MAG: hypothetical protein ABR532_08920 [Candidatus Dormibacteria bacterium]
MRTQAAVGFVIVLMIATAGTSCGRGNSPQAASPSAAEADQEVCSHVHPGPLGAAGDWKTPDVANLAYFHASAAVREAYAAAASEDVPLGATPEQMQQVMAAWGRLGSVCAAVNAQG